MDQGIGQELATGKDSQQNTKLSGLREHTAVVMSWVGNGLDKTFPIIQRHIGVRLSAQEITGEHSKFDEAFAARAYADHLKKIVIGAPGLFESIPDEDTSLQSLRLSIRGGEARTDSLACLQVLCIKGGSQEKVGDIASRSPWQGVSTKVLLDKGTYGCGTRLELDEELTFGFESFDRVIKRIGSCSLNITHTTRQVPKLIGIDWGQEEVEGRAAQHP